MSNVQAHQAKRSKATLIDTTKCVGCRSCQVSCKQWNRLPAEMTELNRTTANLQNPTVLSAKTLAVVTFNEISDDRAPGGLKYVMAKRQCMHCNEPACASACPVTAMHKTAEGPVVYDKSKCIGCRYCMAACPFGVPAAEWDSLAPKISKCTMCHDRLAAAVPAERNGKPLTDEERTRFAAAYAVPACVKQCPAGALKFGDREELLAEARKRIQASPDRYVSRIYGEKEAGGLGMLYLSSVSFEQLGFPEVGTKSFTRESAVALGAVPAAVIGVGAVLGGTYALRRRQAEVAKAEPAPVLHPPQKDVKRIAHSGHHHVEFAPIREKLLTPANIVLLSLAALGAVSTLARFAFGLGTTTNLSDTYPWGLWIVGDLVWIALAAGAFATAGLIYVLRREDLYSIGRAAVLIGLLSYSFVTFILLADLGLPWHAYQVALQTPEHSAMFEVSWCVGLYLSVLAFEFLPVPLERWGLERPMELWRKYSPAYVVVAVTLFVYLMSRKPLWAGLAFAAFTIMAYAFRQRPGEKPVPIMLAIAAVTFSTMHQSSLGSMFLLMRDKLDLSWWSPILPIEFFLSSVAAGTAVIVLAEMWIAKGYSRLVQARQLAAMAQVTFWSLAVYEAVRIGDLAMRGRLPSAFTGKGSAWLLIEIAIGGLLPLLLLASAKRRRGHPGLVALGTSLAAAGVVLNRMNVVVFAQTFKGPMPQIAPASYFPSVVEWGVSIGPIAAAVFLFGWAARVMPVLPREEAASDLDGENMPALDESEGAA